MEKRRFEEYVKRANAIHGNKYDYHKSNVPTCKDKAIFICPIHGEFVQTWDNHLHGKSGCPKCMKCHKYSNAEWIEEASKKHNGKYDYSKTYYTKAKEKVVVICHEKDEIGNEHGEFTIRAGNHMAGIGCPKCAKKYHPTTEEWIKKAQFVHNNKYDYSKTQYTKSSNKVIITCPIHGDFVQEAASHLSGVGCPKCNGGIELTTAEYVNKLKEVHGNRYDYSLVKYVNARQKIDIICPIHGVFQQIPYQHLKGQGCPKCKSSKLENILIRSFDKNGIQYSYQYKLDSKNVFRCDFLLNDYNIIVECQGEQHFIPTSFDKDKSEEKCNEAYQKVITSDSLKYNECISNGFDVLYFTIPSYFNIGNINIHTEFYENKKLFTDVEQLVNYIKSTQKTPKTNNYRRFFADIKENVARNIIDNNGTIRYKDFVVLYVPLVKNERNELNDKRRSYIKRGYKAIIVFEDEYLNRREIVLSKLRHLFKLNTNTLPKIMARKCLIKELDNKQSNNFLEQNHIQGFVNSSVYIGAFYEGNLVAVMSFIKEPNNNWNLSRFASDNRFVCCGIGGKLLKYFMTHYTYDEIKSFADRRWTVSENNIYTNLGFKNVGCTHPDYHYFKQGEVLRHHKFGFRKQSINKKYGLPLSMTESEMTEKLGYERIWDCGLIKYVLKNSNEL